MSDIVYQVPMMIGHVDHLTATRDRVLSTARISPAARRRIMGLPPVHQPACKVHMIDVSCAKPEDRKVISRAVAELRRPKPKPKAETANPFGAIQPPGVTIATVQWAFLDSLYEAGYRLKSPTYATDGRRYQMEDLKCAGRSRDLSWPRHVCIDLVRRIVVGTPKGGRTTVPEHVSYPDLGKHFGRRDHATMIAAVAKAPHVLAEWPVLAAVHGVVLARFAVQP